MNFLITLSAVAIMLFFALPGFLLVRTKTVKSDAVPSFSKVLLYVCQPCLIFRSVTSMTFTPSSALNLGLCFLLTLTIQIAVILLLFLIIGKKRKQVLWRLVCLAAVFSNCGFLGVPLLEALMPDHPEAIAYSAVLSLSMNMIGWTLGMYVISLNKKHISPLKLLLNPATLGFLAALPFYFTGLALPSMLSDAVALLGKASAPLCMLIMGMRLATVHPRTVFGNPVQYLAVALNQIAYPLLVFALLYFLPIDGVMKTALVVMCACPVASMVQNYSELLGEGQDHAADMVLLGTMTSIVTVPLICLIL